jgi:predicted RecA/RadA family phage recombinase
MATNLVKDDARYLQVAASYPATPTSGTPVVFGSIPGVALTDEDANGDITMDCGGVYDLPVAVATTVGAIIYFEVSGSTLIVTAGSNIRFGYALEAQAGAGTIQVKVGY